MIADQVKKDLGLALKNRETLKVSTLRLLLSSIQNKEKEKRYKESPGEDSFLTEEEILSVIRSEAKKRKESIKSFQSGDRNDLAEKEKMELEILQNYLPKEISEEELKEIVKKAIEETGASEMKDMGKVMSQVVAQTKGRADGSKISEEVKKALSLKSGF